MAHRPTAAQPPAPSASFAVLMFFASVYQGMAGPFPADEDARGWAEEVVADEPGWAWSVEPVVHPDALPTAQERARARARAVPHLRLLTGSGEPRGGPSPHRPSAGPAFVNRKRVGSDALRVHEGGGDEAS